MQGGCRCLVCRVDTTGGVLPLTMVPPLAVGLAAMGIPELLLERAGEEEEGVSAITLYLPVTSHS